MKRADILVMVVIFLSLLASQSFGDIGTTIKKKPLLETVAGEKVLALLYKGTNFEILEERGDWIKVSVTGWTRKASVDVIASTEELPVELMGFVQSAKSLMSAAESGMDYEEYKNMLGDLEMSGDLAVGSLRDSSEMQETIKEIMDYFITAGDVWHIQVLEPEAKPCITDGTIELLYTSNYPELQTYVDKYKSLIPQATYFDNVSNHDVLSLSEYCQLLWGKAGEEINKLEVFLNL